MLRAPSYDEAVELVNASPYGNGSGHLHQRRRRGPPVRVRGGDRHGRRERADPGADGVLLLRRLEGSLFGDTHVHGTEGVHFYTRGKVVTSRWLDPSHGGVNLGFPINT